MKNCKRLIIITTLFSILLYSACDRQSSDTSSSYTSKQNLVETKPEEVGMSTDRLKRIDKVMNEYIDRDWIPGAVVIIARHGEIVYHKSFGMRDVEADDTLQKDDIFRMASMTKAITSVAAMMLYEEGFFLLDDPLYKYIPEFKDPVILEKVNLKDSTFTSHPAKNQITIRQLLNHTSGIGYGFTHEKLKPLYDKAGIPDGFVTTDAILGDKMKALGHMPLLHEPGDAYYYGLNTDLLGYFVEVISGKTLKEFFQEKIFNPLGMKETYFFMPDGDEDRLVKIYASTESGYEISTVEEYNYPVKGGKSYYSGGAGLLSTALDYATFLQMLVNGGSYNGHQLLSRKTIEIMTKNQVGDLWGSGAFGLGFGITTETGSAEKLSSVGNYWWGGYFSTSFWIDPVEDLVAVSLTQMFPAWHGKIHQKFQVLTYQAIVD
ncbi:hypothetical protein ES705_13050 [subsurface metagenome]